MKTPHAALQLLRAMRDREAVKLASTGEFGVAVGEVCDELIRRTQVIAEQYPKDEAMTLRLINEMPAVADAIAAILNTAHALSEVRKDGADAVLARREPLLRFAARVESEGFQIAEDWTLTDTADWRPLDDAEPDLLVQREAEAIARAERATAYRERLTRMAAAFGNTHDEYTQRVRNLISTVLDG
ncbi:hypothetical protein M2272_000052 [Mycobacterium frederiksbergense]|uniref:Uncharacterized protein n=1 Tax=Mycolicibacterium frederiksbergense TaxID=117567 RepID=A0ABT6KRS3_9MYCO|nr:hypothetical protein [Mycolicibacterium frederiksbergense]MDH6193431.1 hypothetical protein [Mycolicibacterium frederiksbergense]